MFVNLRIQRAAVGLLWRELSGTTYSRVVPGRLVVGEA